MAFKLGVRPFKTRRAMLRSALVLGLFFALFITHRTISSQEHPEMEFEFQFTEGFSGQNISISIGGQRVAEFTAQTKFQTGLAHIERLDLQDREEVTVTIGDTDIELHLDVDATRPFIVFTLVGGVLNATALERQPGYL